MPLKVEVEDFSGGVTDYYLNAPGNKLRQAENLLLTQYSGMGKPFTRPGSQLYDSANPQIPAGAQRISTAFNYKNILHVQSATKLYWYDSGWTAVSGPTSNDAFIGATTSSYFSYSHWNNHTLITHSGRVRPQKIIINSSNEPEIFEAGLPQIDTSLTTLTPTGSGNNWLYKFVYEQTYVTTGNVTFLDVGTPSLPHIVNGGTSVAIAVLPVLSNGATSNFRTATLKIGIYRTTHNGTTYYKVGEVTNGTTTYNDTTTDANLISGTLLYTTGGVVANDRPPKCKALHVAKDNIAYYVNIEDSTNQILTNRCVQSVPGDIDSVPASFFVDVDDEIVGVSSTKSNTLLLCRRSAYRIDGTYDELGRGGMSADRISDTAGCISAQSVVQALDGVFWLGQDAAYYSDGYRVVRLNADFDKTYRGWTTQNSLTDDDSRTVKYQGKYDRVRNRIWWTIQREGTEVDICYVLDLTWGVKEEACFTLVSGTSFNPTAIEFINGNMIRCDKRGYVLIHKDSLYSDPLIDVNITPANWSQETIMYTLESISYNFGTSITRKYVTGMSVTCEAATNLSLGLTSNNDDNRKVAELKPVRYRGGMTWGDQDVYWGDEFIIWNKQGLISEKRRMPAQSLRCNYKSIKLSNAYVAVINSDSLGTASINAGVSTVTLTGALEWPYNSVGYFIAFENDGYVNEFEITARTATTLTFRDEGNKAVTATGQKWVLRGYPKGEVLNLLNYSLNYEISGPTLGVYNTTDSGEVGT